MKIKKAALIGAVALASLSLAACSSSKNDSSSTSSKITKKVSSADNEKRISQNKEFRTKFDKIKIGDLSQKGQGGSTVTQLKSLLGSPNSSSSTKTSGMKTKSFTWMKDGSTITVVTIDDNAVSKLITGFKFASRPEKLTLKAFDSIKDGSSYDSVVSKFGEPDGLNESLIMGSKHVTATWLTGVKGDSGANAEFDFTNNKLTTKTQTSLK